MSKRVKCRPPSKAVFPRRIANDWFAIFKNNCVATTAKRAKVEFALRFGACVAFGAVGFEKCLIGASRGGGDDGNYSDENNDAHAKTRRRKVEERMPHVFK